MISSAGQKPSFCRRDGSALLTGRLLISRNAGTRGARRAVVRHEDRGLEAERLARVEARDPHALQRRPPVHRLRVPLQDVEPDLRRPGWRPPVDELPEQLQRLRPPLPLPRLGARDARAVLAQERVGEPVRGDFTLAVVPRDLSPLEVLEQLRIRLPPVPSGLRGGRRRLDAVVAETGEGHHREPREGPRSPTIDERKIAPCRRPPGPQPYPGSVPGLLKQDVIIRRSG